VSEGQSKWSARELSPAELQNIIWSFLCPRTLRRDPQGTFEVAQLVALYKSPAIKDPKGGQELTGDVADIASDYVVTVNEMETSVEWFKTTWEKKAYESGFMNISIALSASFPIKGLDVGVGASHGQSEQSASSDQSAGSSVYLVGVHEVRKFKIHIPDNRIILDPEVVKKFEAAFTAFKKATEHRDATDRAVAVAAAVAEAKAKAVLDEFGYFVITDYTIGGKLYFSVVGEYLKKKHEEAKTFERQFAAALSVGKGPVSVSVSGGVGHGNESESSQRDTSQSFSSRMQAKGGDEASRPRPAAWATSLTAGNCEIISYDRLVPIYSFLQGDVQAFYKDSMNKITAVLQDKALQRRVLYSLREQDRKDAKSIKPAIDSTRHFKDSDLFVDTNWVEVPEGRFFTGAALYKKENRLGISLRVTDSTFSEEETIVNTNGCRYRFALESSEN